jgi:hypothetical protein
MNQNDFSPSDSLATIEKAFRQANGQKTGAAFYYILWGGLLFIYFILQFFALRYPDKATALKSAAWVVFPIGGLLSFVRSKRDDKKDNFVPLIEKVYTFAWGGVGLALGIMALFGVFLKTDLYSTIIILLFGLASFITGGVIKFMPSIAGSIICMICAGFSLAFPLDVRFLLAAIGMLSACLIPGIFMTRSKAKNV